MRGRHHVLVRHQGPAARHGESAAGLRPTKDDGKGPGAKVAVADAALADGHEGPDSSEQNDKKWKYFCCFLSLSLPPLLPSEPALLPELLRQRVDRVGAADGDAPAGGVEAAGRGAGGLGGEADCLAPLLHVVASQEVVVFAEVKKRLA